MAKIAKYNFVKSQIMKRACKLLLLLVIFPTAIFAQEELKNGLLFPEFTEGITIYSNGNRVKALLNYDTVEEQMIFKSPENDQILAIANSSDILGIVIDKRRFVPIQKDVFYEEIEAGKDYLYIQKKSKIISVGKGTAYNSTSGATAINTVSKTPGTGGDYARFSLNEKFEVKTDQYFYLKIKNQYKKFYSAKTLAKLVKGKESEIEQYASDHHIDFNKMDDVLKILKECVYK